MRRDDDIQRIAELFREAIRLQAGAVPEPYLKLELTLLQLKAVLLLYAKGPMSTSVLAQAIDVSPAVATGLVDRLEAQRLISRQVQTSDRRVVLISITTDGLQLVEGITTAGVARLTDLLTVLTDDQLDALRYGYAAVVDALRQNLAGGSVVSGRDGACRPPKR